MKKINNIDPAKRSYFHLFAETVKLVSIELIYKQTNAKIYVIYAYLFMSIFVNNTIYD